MTTNTHILTLSKQIDEAKNLICLLPLSAEKQRFERLMEEMELQLFCVEKDFENAMKRVGELAAENYGAVVTAQEGISYFCHITPLCISKQMAAHVENHLRKACAGKASVLWETIHQYELMGYLNTTELSAKQIYDDLTNYFGKLHFSERTFRMYR